MKKLIYLLLAGLIVAIIVSFAIDEFMVGYGLAFVLISIFTTIGHIYGIDNQIYLHKKKYHDDYDKKRN